MLALFLSGCGVTQWQRDEEVIARLAQANEALHSPEMEQAIRDAKPGVPRVP